MNWREKDPIDWTEDEVIAADKAVDAHSEGALPSRVLTTDRYRGKALWNSVRRMRRYY